MDEDKSVKNILNDIKSKDNAYLLPLENTIANKFRNNYNQFSNNLFFRVANNCGGIVIDNWIRLYGCGTLNIVDKNSMIKNNTDFDIIIGEDICGGLFALKENLVYYFAPDTLKWESLNIYYSNFLNWLLNSSDDAAQFYASFRWTDWKFFCRDIKLNQGISFYPQLCFKSDIEKRSKKVINMDEIIRLNFELSKQLK